MNFTIAQVNMLISRAFHKSVIAEMDEKEIAEFTGLLNMRDVAAGKLIKLGDIVQCTESMATVRLSSVGQAYVVNHMSQHDDALEVFTK